MEKVFEKDLIVGEEYFMSPNKTNLGIFKGIIPEDGEGNLATFEPVGENEFFKNEQGLILFESNDESYYFKN